MSSGTSEAPRTAYRLRAVEFAACNCKHGCNCQFGGFPNDGFCEFILACQVSDGRYGDVDLTGTRFAVAFRYPNAIHEGNGRAVWFLEETATEEQATALEAIQTARAGGMPWEAMATTSCRSRARSARPSRSCSRNGAPAPASPACSTSASPHSPTRSPGRRRR